RRCAPAPGSPASAARSMRWSENAPRDPRPRQSKGDRMSWLTKLLPPRIKSNPGVRKTPVPEGLWIKCPSCEAVLYRTDLEKNLHVCPKCGHHQRVGARERIEQLLDPEGRFEMGSGGG